MIIHSSTRNMKGMTTGLCFVLLLGCGNYSILDHDNKLAIEAPMSADNFDLDMFTHDRMIEIRAFDPTGSVDPPTICFVDDISLGELDSPPYQWEWRATVDDTGDHLITLQSEDDLGNRTESTSWFSISKPAPLSIEVDRESPVILNRWDDPTDVTFNTNIPTDHPLARVSLFVDNILYEEITTGPYNFLWSADIDNLGIHEIQIVAENLTGVELIETETIGVCKSSDSGSAGTFLYRDFSSTAGLTLLRQASSNNSVLRLTPSVAWEAGLAWYNNRQDVQSGFETEFDFRITDRQEDGADGFAFVVQAHSQTAQGHGYVGIPRSIAVAFDTYYNEDHGDPNDNHISVQTNGMFANTYNHDYRSLATNIQIPQMGDGAVHTVRIVYKGDVLSIYMDDLETSRINVEVDIDALLNLNGAGAWVGLTAQTGGAFENHDILRWGYWSGEVDEDSCR